MVKNTKPAALSRPLISIITPVFNAENFIAATIASVQAQTYENWELLLVDDKSSDASAKIIEDFAKKDKRIKLIKNPKNSGTAISRNRGIEAAKGNYICFIDADDLWLPSKLQAQLDFMAKNHSAFSFTSYEFASADGNPSGKKVHVPATITYKQALKNTTIFVSTVMLDMSCLKKSQIAMPNVKSEDSATWWQILKTIDHADGLGVILTYYRRSASSHSANKFAAARQTWHLYRHVEHFGFLRSLYYFSVYALNAVKRRL